MATQTHKVDSSRVVLWASAFIIAALVITQAGKLPGNPAFADGAVTGNGFAVLTSDSGRGEDADPDEILVVIDNTAEVMFVYELDARGRQLILRDAGHLPTLYRNALR